MSVQQHRKYDPDFKRNAVLLSEDPDRSVAEVADKLMLMLPQAVYTPVPEDAGKDITEAYLAGLDLHPVIYRCLCFIKTTRK